MNSYFATRPRWVMDAAPSVERLAMEVNAHKHVASEDASDPEVWVNLVKAEHLSRLKQSKVLAKLSGQRRAA